MATRYAPVARCVELPEREVLAALLSREECGRVIARIAAMPVPRTATRVLAALVARLATPACSWLEGALAVELFEELGSDEAPTGTTIRVMAELGAGLRERVLAPIAIAEPLAEIVAALERRHDLTTFARIERVSGRCALVVARDRESGGSLGSADPSGLALFEISETSLALHALDAPDASAAAPSAGSSSFASGTARVARLQDGRSHDDIDDGWDEVAAS